MSTKRKNSTPVQKTPHCTICGAHIGWHAEQMTCGACRKPLPLTRAELRQMRKLTISHWGDGSIRSLLIGSGGYRPTLVVNNRDLKKFAAITAEMCQQRADLADLYDRMQASRGDQRRACRN